MSLTQSVMNILSLPIIESKIAQPGKIYVLGNDFNKRLVVNNMWNDIELPLIISKARKELNDHLAKLVAEAEKRLFG